jgi:DNA-binding transcriptional MerR regulator/methylmalonyl-CoA mutase cobalamin-binding subunit
MKNERRFPIKTVSKLTGLSTHAIRAWEKRYQLVKPFRTETNRRLYSEDDIGYLKLLHKATRAGHSIGSIADMDRNALRSLIGKEDKQNEAVGLSSAASQRDGVAAYLEDAIQALINFDDMKLENILMNASVELTQPVLIDDFVIQLLEKIGELWRDGTIRIMHEHLATEVIGSFLTNLRRSYRPDPKAPVLVVCTPSGQVHEMGALTIALIAASEGWRVVYLGPDLPVVEMAAAVLKDNARAVALSITHTSIDFRLNQDLQKLPDMLPSNVQIIIGGRGAGNYQTNSDRSSLTWIKNFDQFREFLSSQK